MRPTGNKNLNVPGNYDNYYFTEEGKFFRIPVTRREFIIESIRIWGGEVDKVLDLGCGWGELFDFLPFTFTGTGLDFAEATIERNRIKRPHHKWVKADFEHEIHLQDELFDFVFCGETLEHMTNPLILVSEINRVTSKGGLIIVTVPLDEKNNDPWHMWYFSFIDLVGLYPNNMLINYKVYDGTQQCAAWIKK